MATFSPSLTTTSKVSHRHDHYLYVWTLVVCLVALSLNVVVVTGAFTSSSPASSVLRIGPTRLFSSPTSLTPDEEDEISKLIGKRNQIKRKRQEDIANIIESNQETLEPTVDLDLSKLPEFKIERPIRNKSQSSSDTDNNNNNDIDSNKNKNKKKKPDAVAAPIVDFKADYDDENELLHIPNRIGITTCSWGDVSQNFVPSGKLTKSMIKNGMFVPGDLQTSYTKLLERGITFIETSSSYGSASRTDNLSALDILKRCLQEQNTDDLPETMICTSLGSSSAWSKLLPSRLTQSLYDAVERLQTSSIELFVIPKSFLYPTRFIVKALATAIESGCCNNVGVQGVTRASTLRKIARQLQDEYDVTLVSNAFEYSLTNTKHEYMIQVCKELNIIPIILNPLDNGLASGIYTATNPSGGQAGSSSSSSSSSPSIAINNNNNNSKKFTFAQLEKLQPLHSIQETVAERVRTRVIREMQNLQDRVKGSGKSKKYNGPSPNIIINTDITTTQIAINYIIAKGGVPLIPVNTPRQVDEVLGSLGWTLTNDEIEMLDSAAALCNLSRKYPK